MNIFSVFDTETTGFKPNEGARIIEIGNYEKINGAYNLWYKVEIDNVTGWVFGGLCTTCLNAN